MTLPPAIEITQLNVNYGQISALKEVSLSIPDGGHLVGVLGPNGAGKSSLLKAILGLCPTQSGKCLFFGSPLKGLTCQIAYVPQKDSIDWTFPISVYELIMMGRYGHLKWFQRPTFQDKEIVDKSILELGLTSVAKRQIHELSGGQKQRAFLARSLVQDAKIYLLDEPFSGIDQTTQEVVIELLKRLKKNGKTVLVVHHDLKSVAHFFDWAILINKKLIASGPLNISLTTETLAQTYKDYVP